MTRHQFAFIAIMAAAVILLAVVPLIVGGGVA